MENTKILEKLESAVFGQDVNGFDAAMGNALNNKTDHSHIEQSLINGLDRVRKKLLSNESSLPELLISLDLTADGLKRLKKEMTDTTGETEPVTVVIGVVEGDPHDLGKNIISLIYESYGYRVTDLGAHVPKEEFIKRIKEERPDILALSAMMSTTMSSMPDIIEEAKKMAPKTLVMVGGAPLDERLAKDYGADGYAESAVTVIEETHKVLGSRGNLRRLP
ncbi:MAG: cobalamin-dependent protein [Desulfobacterales bacterium]